MKRTLKAPAGAAWNQPKGHSAEEIVSVPYRVDRLIFVEVFTAGRVEVYPVAWLRSDPKTPLARALLALPPE